MARTVAGGTTTSDGSGISTDFNSILVADKAYQKWVQSGGGNDGSTPPAPDGSGVWSGSLDAPSKLKRGTGFSASATIKNVSSQEASATFYLAVPTKEGLYPLAQQAPQPLPAKESVDLSFEVPQTAVQIPPGDYKLVVYAEGAGQGTVAKRSVTVVASDAEGNDNGGPNNKDGNGGNNKDGSGGDDSMNGWSPPKRVQELPFGWFLYAQQKKVDGETKTRFLIVGKKNGNRIYLHTDGTVGGKPEFYQKPEAVNKALKKYAKRRKNGDVPAENQPSGQRPTPEGVKKDVMNANTSLAGGNAKKKLLIGAVVVVGLGMAYYAQKNGNLPSLNKVFSN